jgi:hypothetical protein
VNDSGDAPLVDVQIELFDASNGAVIGTTVTDSLGKFTFSVAPGKYTVCETNPSGYVDVADSDSGDFRERQLR